VQIIAMTASCWAPVRPGSAVLIPARHYAAVHVPDRASHPRGLVGQQEADRLGDVLRTAYPADWVEAVETLKRRLTLSMRWRLTSMQRGAVGRPRIWT
jgi:hypothetical protein